MTTQTIIAINPWTKETVDVTEKVQALIKKWLDLNGYAFDDRELNIAVDSDFDRIAQYVAQIGAEEFGRIWFMGCPYR